MILHVYSYLKAELRFQRTRKELYQNAEAEVARNLFCDRKWRKKAATPCGNHGTGGATCQR